MGLKCIVCGVSRVKSGNLSFHSFPKDSKRKTLWMTACNIKLCLPSYRVCSNHFTNDQYELSGYLKKEAVPMSYKLDVLMLSNNELYVLTPTPTSKPQESVKATKAPQADCRSVNNTDCVKPTKRHKRFNANTIGDLDVCHFSTPMSAKRHLLMLKDKYKNKQIQNHNLKKQRKRLQNKLAKYEDLIKKLQAKNNLLIVNVRPESIIHTSNEKEKDDDKKIILVEHDHNYLNSICVKKEPRRLTCAQGHGITTREAR